jgi:uncharacterized membrane protein YphA (DoxX/SURF4 family)
MKIFNHLMALFISVALFTFPIFGTFGRIMIETNIVADKNFYLAFGVVTFVVYGIIYKLFFKEQ